MKLTELRMLDRDKMKFKWDVQLYGITIIDNFIALYKNRLIRKTKISLTRYRLINRGKIEIH